MKIHINQTTVIIKKGENIFILEAPKVYPKKTVLNCFLKNKALDVCKKLDLKLIDIY